MQAELLLSLLPLLLLLLRTASRPATTPRDRCSQAPQ